MERDGKKKNKEEKKSNGNIDDDEFTIKSGNTTSKSNDKQNRVEQTKRIIRWKNCLS